MDSLFYIRLVVSFIVGGGFIAFMTFLAEKVPRRVAGLILAFPSTSALGFFFLAWSTSADAVADVAPSTLIPLGIAPLFVFLYLLFARYFAKKSIEKYWQIFFSFVFSILFWFLFSVPVVYFQIQNLYVAIVLYITLLVVGHYLLNVNRITIQKRSVSYTYIQKIGRAIFVGFIISLVVLFSELFGPFWGALFAMFPASFGSALLIMHRYYFADEMTVIFKNAAIGTIALFFYILVAMYSFPEIGYIWGTVVAYIVSAGVAVIVAWSQKKFLE